MIIKPRKLTSIGYSTYVSLPHDWLYHHKLGKGCLVYIEIREDNTLVIKPKENENGRNE